MGLGTGQTAVASRRINNPFPREPAGMPLVKGDLVFDATCIPDQKYRIGTQFTLHWDGARGGALSVTHDRSG